MQKIALADSKTTVVYANKAVNVTSIEAYLSITKEGDFAGHAFELDPDYEWMLGESNGRMLLVPVKK